MADLPELIVHIGAGKAGSTSLQFTLRRNAEALSAAGLSYMGLALEEIPGAERHGWCERDRPQLFFSSGPDDYIDVKINGKQTKTHITSGFTAQRHSLAP